MKLCLPIQQIGFAVDVHGSWLFLDLNGVEKAGRVFSEPELSFLEVAVVRNIPPDERWPEG